MVTDAGLTLAAAGGHEGDQECEDRGAFEGMLPAGHYTFVSVDLVVEVGDETRVVIEPPPARCCG